MGLCGTKEENDLPAGASGRVPRPVEQFADDKWKPYGSAFKCATCGQVGYSTPTGMNTEAKPCTNGSEHNFLRFPEGEHSFLRFPEGESPMPAVVSQPLPDPAMEVSH